MKSVRIRSFSGPYFLAFKLNTESYYGNIRTRKTPNMDTFHAAINIDNIDIKKIFTIRALTVPFGFQFKIKIS